MKMYLSLALISVLIAGCTTSQVGSDSRAAKSTVDTPYEVVLASDVEWTHLNPKRGDLAPKAATLWGDRNGTGPTGFLLKPSDGFQSPPHIHNVSYRGVVIVGVVHNDDKNAENMWMPAGSFWTQPKGEVHITCAKGSATLAYIEIEEGPYLVLPEDEAFDSGERPVNVDKSNIVWLDASDITWIDMPGVSATAKEPQMAFLWGKPQEGQLSGTFIKLPAGFNGKISSNASTFRAVVIQGRIQHQVPGQAVRKTLEAGSYFGSTGKSSHRVSTTAEGETILYVRTDGKYEITAGDL